MRSDIEERLDTLTMKIMGPLRMDKTVATDALDDLCELVTRAREDDFFEGSIEVKLAGKFWWLFCAMLAEADHAREPDEILNAAWRYQDELRRSFGPRFH